MKWGEIANSRYQLNEPALMLRRPGACRYVLEDINAAGMGHGRHYEISFFLNANLVIAKQRFVEDHSEAKRVWFVELGGDVAEFGSTYSHIGRVPLELIESSARRLIARNNGMLTKLSIFSPVFGNEHAR